MNAFCCACVSRPSASITSQPPISTSVRSPLAITTCTLDVMPQTAGVNATVVVTMTMVNLSSDSRMAGLKACAVAKARTSEAAQLVAANPGQKVVGDD